MTVAEPRVTQGPTVAERVRQERFKQGLPATITDESVLRRIALLLLAESREVAG